MSQATLSHTRTITKPFALTSPRTQRAKKNTVSSVPVPSSNTSNPLSTSNNSSASHLRRNSSSTSLKHVSPSSTDTSKSSISEDINSQPRPSLVTCQSKYLPPGLTPRPRNTPKTVFLFVSCFLQTSAFDFFDLQPF